ncbi:MAG: hypothetical protein ABJP34_08515 [Erythrobacter sp.]
MRIALLSAVKINQSGERAADLPFLGRTVLAAQFELAVELGAERIVCLTAGQGKGQAPETLSLQHHVEEGSIDFHIIASHLALTRLVSADDELITIEDGVLIDRAAISAEMASERGLLCVPEVAGTARGFQRIDARWAWAGLMIIRGDMVSRLADLPADSDPASLLLRIALQARVPIVALGEDHLAAGTVLQPQSAEELVQRESRLISSALEERSWAGPGTKLARMVSLKMMPGALPKGSVHSAIASGVLGFGAACLAAASLPIPGAIALVFAAFSAAMHGGFTDIEKSLPSRKGIRTKVSNISNLLDILIVISLTAILGLSGPTLSVVFASIAVIALRLAAHAARRLGFSPWQDLWEDRLVLSIVIVISEVFGQLAPLLAAISLSALVFALICDEKFGLRQT